jgi:predicted lipoprotein with Yx(FWY)xxD motif
MNRPQTFPTVLAATLAVALVFAACGDSDDGASGSPSDSSSATAVSIESVDGVGDVLVDADGAALYTAEQESDGRVRCIAACAEIWIPLTLPAGAQPTGPDRVESDLGVTERPDGARQPTLDGKPLYRFADDGMAGEVNGDGLSDTFGGRRFTWRVATAEGESEGIDPRPDIGPYG